jgi:hypothetical protein
METPIGNHSSKRARYRWELATVTNTQFDSLAPSSVSARSFVTREWPYLAMLILALFGVAYASVTQRPMTLYWLALAPFIGIFCVITRWRDVQSREMRLPLIWIQALHWGAVLAAMNLIFVADVGQMMNADARALSLLTLLALGTFTAGVHVAAWRICLVGVLLAVGVPAIAWLEQRALLLLLAAVVLLAVTAPFWWPHAKHVDKRGRPGTP